MRIRMLTLALVLAVSPLWAQTAVQRALDASRAVTAHDHATAEQAGEAVRDGGHGGDHAGHQDQSMTGPVDESAPGAAASGSLSGSTTGTETRERMWTQ